MYFWIKLNHFDQSFRIFVMKIWYQYPFVRLILPFITGIVTAIYFDFPLNFSLVPLFLLLLLVYGLLVFIRSWKINYKIRWLNGILLHLLMFCTGYENTRLQTGSHYAENISHFSVQNSGILVQIDEPVTERPNSYKIVAKALMFADSLSWRKASGKVMLYFEKDSVVRSIRYGDQLIISTTLSSINPPMNPGEFNYKRYLSYRRIYDQGFVKANGWKILSRNHGNRLKAFGIHLRETLMDILQKQNIKGKEYAVATAILLGYDGFLEPEQVKEFSGSGAMHILCVSGLHVGIIYFVLNSLLMFMDKNRKTKTLKVILLVLLIWLYALVTGLSPSVMRASLMFSFVAFGGLLSRKTNIYNTLTASAFLLLVINPYFIADVGFQLSYLAVFGIVWLYKPLENLFVLQNRLLRYVWQISMVSVAATIMTFPISLYYFHQFPNLFLVTNLIAIPASMLIIYTGIVVLGASFFPSVSMLFAKLLTGIVWALNFSVNIIEKQSFAVSRGVYVNFIELLLLFCLILCCAMFFFIKRKTYFYFGIIVLTMFLSSVTIRKYNNLKAGKMIVYCVNKATMIDFIHGKNGILFIDSTMKSDDNRMSYHIQNNRIISGVKFKEGLFTLAQNMKNDYLFKSNNFIQFYDKTLVRIDQDFHFNPTQEKFIVNYLLISHDPSITISDLAAAFDFGMIIIDNSNSYWKTNQWIKECDQLGMNYFSVRSQGAFIVQI